MPWKLEAWNPEYALPERVGGEDEGRGLEEVKTHYEGHWTARTPAKVELHSWPIVYLVDGRQRIDAQIADSRGRRALLATVIAGAVLRDGAGIRPVGEPRKEHILLHSAELEEPLPPGLGHYRPIQTSRSDPASLRARVTEQMRRLEASLVNELEGGLVIVDGQIFPGAQAYKAPERILGYTKTQAATYLGPEEQALLHNLEPHQRTPIFSIPGYALRRPLDVFSWYVRLPLEPSAPFYSGAALLRVETPTSEPAEASKLADLSVNLFCTLASSPARDPRAPQNLIPIGGLEQWLGRHLGHGEVIRRRIVQALFA
ncbi:DNA double-strand break repair nuclease NurA [Meiothermus hypogaeus]|uniref:Nuclease n=2 Tax=Meiothermus hypogaeus TaxID=884155 RepID=A0A511QXR7_9DEIN|nr:DNA double-strand break repair nuclease NurA [Meiothermus hypogaeus]RIH79101.1 hypothetical protein Mhypo_01266 [Meiothermus hypogaeus]GEM82175.1 nuclease [Meiothermus hypogaeus NBRC 106114]